MAVTVTADQDVLTKAKKRVVGDQYEVRGLMTFGAGYPTGGEPVTGAMFGMQRLDSIDVFGSGAEEAVYDRPNSKVKLFTADGVEAANASNPGASVRFIARGRG